MKSEWNKYKIEDIADVKSGKRLPKGHSLMPMKTDYPYIRLVDVSDGLVSESNMLYLSGETHEKISRYIVTAGDICLAIVGNTIGMVFQIDKRWNNVNLTENAARLTNFKDTILSTYLYYYLISFEGRNEILSRKVGSAQGKLPMYNIKSLEVPIPPLPTQKKIAHILSTLDDKIELNRKMNETLEAMAQALFKSWFVDFDPVHARAKATSDAELEAAAREMGISRELLELFPSTFVESEMRMVPEGWEVKPLDEVAHYQNGLALQKFRPKDEKHYLPVLKIAQLKKGYADGEEKADIDIKPECIVDSGDVVFSWSGSLVVDVWCGGKVALNQHLFKVTSNEYAKWFYYHWTKQHLANFQRVAAAKAVTMGHIKRNHLAEALCVIPDSIVFDMAEKVIKPLLDKLIKNRLEINSLEKTRDTLLPKLLSGELDVSEVDIGTES